MLNSSRFENEVSGDIVLSLLQRVIQFIGCTALKTAFTRTVKTKMKSVK